MMPHTFSQRVLKLLTVLVVFALTTLAVIVSQETASNINPDQI
jgi:sensor histidine kinase regulating citrate/malate metabolism